MTDTTSENTTIQIKRDLRAWLVAQRRGLESYDDVLRRLLGLNGKPAGAA